MLFQEEAKRRQREAADRLSRLQAERRARQEGVARQEGANRQDGANRQPDGE